MVGGMVVTMSLDLDEVLYHPIEGSSWEVGGRDNSQLSHAYEVSSMAEVQAS